MEARPFLGVLHVEVRAAFGCTGRTWPPCWRHCYPFSEHGWGVFRNYVERKTVVILVSNAKYQNERFLKCQCVSSFSSLLLSSLFILLFFKTMRFVSGLRGPGKKVFPKYPDFVINLGPLLLHFGSPVAPFGTPVAPFWIHFGTSW